MTITDESRQQLEQFRNDFSLLKSEISKVIVGQSQILDDTILALVAGGHVLLQGVPGLGKTLLVRTMADALELDFSRIQFTPDLMPADLIGTNMVIESDEGQKIFQRVLRRQHKKWLVQNMSCTANGNGMFLHRFQQSGLSFWRRAVYFVCQQHICE